MKRPLATTALALAIAALGTLASCGGGGSGPPPHDPAAPASTAAAPSSSAPAAGSGAAAAPGVSSVISADILAREPLANTASVKHILISWRDLGESFGGRIDPRAEKRSKADAEAEVRSVVKQLAEGADFDAMMKAHSEDLGSAMAGRAFTVTPDAQLVIEFRQLSLRLRPGEVGVCQSDFGFHIIKRIT
jgi:hypothetical protein